MSRSSNIDLTRVNVDAHIRGALRPSRETTRMYTDEYAINT